MVSGEVKGKSRGELFSLVIRGFPGLGSETEARLGMPNGQRLPPVNWLLLLTSLGTHFDSAFVPLF